MIEAVNPSETVQAFFGEIAEQVARETGFVQRTSKVSGAHWLRMWVFGFLETPDASLNQLAQVSTDLGVDLTAQGIDDRVAAPAARYMAAMFRRSLELFQNQLTLPVPLLERFSEVQVLDSTQIALPASLQDEFPGSRGAAAEASLKIHLTLELRRGKWQIVLGPGCQPDRTYAALDPIVPGSLRLADLGYSYLDTWVQIDRGDAYFLSRLNLSTCVFDPATGESIDLLAWLRASSETAFERDIQLGANQRLPVRLVAFRLPQDAVDQRRQKAREAARRKGRPAPTAYYLALLAWNLFVTNVPTDHLNLHEVELLYRVRWQIELIFKVWKSEAWLDRVGEWRQARIWCELYAKLIGLVFTQLWFAPLRWNEAELSLTKVYQCVRRHALRLVQSLRTKTDLNESLDYLQTAWRKFGCKDKRKTQPSTLEQLRRLGEESTALA